MTQQVFFVEPYYSGSHKAFADGFARHAPYEVRLFTLPGRHWKWRMHGAAVTLARMVNEAEIVPDWILATSMMDVALFKSLLKPKLAKLPVVVYFHENQFAYPWSQQDRDVKSGGDHHYRFINYTTALLADVLLFNSFYNKNSFLNALPGFLNMFPDYRNKQTIDEIMDKAGVLPLKLDLKMLDRYRETKNTNATPVILWNHRWEYDKDPGLFFDTLQLIKKEGIAFQLIVTGERFEMIPSEFMDAEKYFKKELIHLGYVESRGDYARLLWRSDILPVTSKQDFFGISAIEAMYCEVSPILPETLAFPEHLRKGTPCFYKDNETLFELLKTMLLREESRVNARSSVARYDWSNDTANWFGAIEKKLNAL